VRVPSVVGLLALRRCTSPSPSIRTVIGTNTIEALIDHERVPTDPFPLTLHLALKFWMFMSIGFAVCPMFHSWSWKSRYLLPFWSTASRKTAHCTYPLVIIIAALPLPSQR